MPQYSFEITLVLQAPILSQATGGRRYGVDTITILNDEGNPSLLGSSIRGNLREVWEYFVKKQLTDQLTYTQIDTWLGQESPKASQNIPHRACVSFDYYWQAKAEKKQALRHRICINQETGAVAHGALQVIESPYITGEEVSFTGKIHALLLNDKEKEILLHWLRKGLGYIHALGAFRGVGFGKVIRVDINQIIKSNVTVQQSLSSPTSTQFGIALTIDRPFCFSHHHNQRHHNHFAAVAFIPGAAILATIAQQAEKNSLLKQYVDKIHISHAFPSKTDQIKRALAIPYSWVSVNKQIYDVSLKKKPGLIQELAPAFQPDWKEEMRSKAKELCGQCEPTRSVHVHTAIDSQKGSSQEGALFSMEVIHPTGYQWLANVNCQCVPQESQQSILQELHTLFAQGLYNLGKTKAIATVVNYYSQPYEYTVEVNQLPQKQGDIFVLMLQTSALLLPNFDDIPATNGDQQLFAQYTQVWKTLAKNSLPTDMSEQSSFTLSHFYARQAMVGGDYLKQRFWSQRAEYCPEILTLAGSVFVFEVEEIKNTQTILNQWITQGLPQHPNTQGGEYWQQNPYIANNGYGEIVINPQWKTASLEGAWYEL